MDWVFPAFVVAAVIHVVEEYVFPGGFSDTLKRLRPGFAPFITTRFAVIINALFIVLCIAGTVVGSRNLVFSLSVASLLFFNGLVHSVATLVKKRYVPGVISGVILYLPLSLFAYYYYATSGQLTLFAGGFSALLGVLYQVVSMVYLALMAMAKWR